MKRRISKILALAFLGVFLTVALTGCLGQKKIGVIDVDQVVAKSSVAKKYQEQLSTKGKEITERLQNSKLTGAEKEKEQQQAYNEFIQLKQDLETKLDQQIKTAVGEVAKDKGIDTVLFKKDVRYGGTDVTQDVITKLK